MTIRAIVLGLPGAAFFCGFTYFNDAVMRQTMFIGNTMPISVYGSLIVFVLVPNVVLFWLSKRLALSGKELAVVLALTLAACCIPGSGLMRSFTSSIILPHYFNRLEPGWQEQGVLAMTPKPMLADVGGKEDVVLNGFINGLAHGQRHIAFTDVPWRAWIVTLTFWVIVLLSLWTALVGLAVVVHRQWSDHEQLPYPVAAFANSLLPREGQPRGEVFRSRLFWAGAIIVLLIHLNNYAYRWFPLHLAAIDTSVDLSPLAKLFPTFEKGQGAFLLTRPLYFTAMAFAYFLAADVALSLGIAPFLYAIVAGVLFGYGVSLRGGGVLSLKIQTFLNFGAYFGMFLGLVYTGRYYYSRVLRQALLIPAGEQLEAQLVWAARVFLIGAAVFAAALVAVGLDWQLALFYTLGTVMIFLVMGRITAETGLFFIQPWSFPCVILWGLLGARALGPRAILIMMILSMVLLIDPREALMPFMVNSLKLVDLRQARVGRTAALCVLALVVGLAVAIPVTLYFQYDRGANMADWWADRMVPMMPFDETVRVRQRLAAQNSLELSDSLAGWHRFAEAAPAPSCLLGFGAGLGLVLVCTAGRLRFPKWPIHPVLFLVWSSYPGQEFAPSLLAGWFVKTMVTRYGGARIYQRLKPLMFGLIAGDMLGGVIPIGINLVYHLVTGDLPKPFNIMPT